MNTIKSTPSLPRQENARCSLMAKNEMVLVSIRISPVCSPTLESIRIGDSSGQILTKTSHQKNPRGDESIARFARTRPITLTRLVTVTLTRPVTLTRLVTLAGLTRLDRLIGPFDHRWYGLANVAPHEADGSGVDDSL